MNIIDSFMDHYEQHHTEYEAVRSRVQQTIEKELHDAGIMAIPSSRVKEYSRLCEKLNVRNKEKNYQTLDDILADIPDLIGARIALYFPDDKLKIKSLLEHSFEIVHTKVFPEDQRQYKGYDRRFSGYSAIHYRVKFKTPSLTSIGNPIVEIQVASLLMHAWSEVEHDLAYKTKKGLVSYDEYEALDEINGLVIAGEISLQRLQRISSARMENESKSISNHYQLASYLYEKASGKTNEREIYLGDVDALFKLYSDLGRLTLSKIDNDLKKVDFEDTTPIAQQMLDLHTDMYLSRTTTVIANKAQKTSTKNTVEINDAKIGAFLKKWVALEKKLKELVAKYCSGMVLPRDIEKAIPHKGVLPPEYVLTYRKLRTARNKMVHEMEIPSSEEFLIYDAQMNTMLHILNTISQSHEG